MPSAIICSFPAYGHVRPMLAAATVLVRRGWRVRFICGKPFADEIAATGAEFVPLSPEFDEELRPAGRGSASLNDLRKIFFWPVPGQVRLLRRLLDEAPADVVISEAGCSIGPRALLGAPRSERPLLVCCSVFPLAISSRDTAQFGMAAMPPRNGLERGWYQTLAKLTTKVALRPIHRDLEKLFTDIGAPGGDGRFFLDYFTDQDLLAQFSVPGFEYPRSDAPANLRFFGPASRVLPSKGGLPPWWDELDPDLPIVHVTQGTSFNNDFGTVVDPVVAALADRPVQVLVATGGRPVQTLAPLPANAYAAEFLPYDLLLPRCAVFVTNGGFGGVNAALEYGVPIVQAGGVADQAETGQRIAWAGVGRNLGSKVPTAQAIRDAVDAVLTDPSYRQACARLAAEIAVSTGADGLVDVIEEQVKRDAPEVSSPG